MRIATLALIALLTASCSASRITGIYVNHGTDFVEMLQLTQTDNGKLNGVFTSVQLQSDGKLTSDQSALTGVVDENQLTLSSSSTLAHFFGAVNVAGSVLASGIKFQMVDSHGDVLAPLFVRSTGEQFKRYTDALKAKGQGTILTRQLLEGSERFRQSVKGAESWISNAQLHVSRIPDVRAAYNKVEDQMRSLLAREQHLPARSVARSQTSVAVNQADIAGEQIDIQVNQIWQFQIEESGAAMFTQFTSWDGNCGTADQLNARRRQGATEQALDAWSTSCKQAVAERGKFIPVYQKIMQQRAELKSFQAAAQEHRKALVHEADTLDNAL